tara:strand:- start:809 stop:1027 length:219 start_codon:yes stop_codon:yes gene_type:complete
MLVVAAVEQTNHHLVLWHPVETVVVVLAGTLVLLMLKMEHLPRVVVEEEIVKPSAPDMVVQVLSLFVIKLVN